MQIGPICIRRLMPPGQRLTAQIGGSARVLLELLDHSL
jgi:hypothetical protein